MFLICSALIEHVQKQNEHYDGALLTLSDESPQLVASSAPGLKVKRSKGYTLRFASPSLVSDRTPS